MSDFIRLGNKLVRLDDIRTVELELTAVIVNMKGSLSIPVVLKFNTTIEAEYCFEQLVKSLGVNNG